MGGCVQGGVTPIGAMSRAATRVTNGQGIFWGSFKRSSGVLGPISSIARRPRGVAEILHMQLVDGQRVKGKNLPWSSSQAGPFLDGQKS